MCKPNIIEVNDLDLEELRPYLCRSEVQLLRYYEPAPGIFLAESPRVIGRALDAGYEPLSLLVERSLIEGQTKEIIGRCGDIPIYVADREVLLQITGFGMTQGVLCAMRRHALPPVEKVCRGAARVAVLEDVVNPTNVGAIFRCAAALNFDAVLLTPACCDPLYRRSVRVSMGTVFQIPWTYLDVTEPNCAGGLKIGSPAGGMSHPGAESDNAGKMKTVPPAGGMGHPEAEPDNAEKMKTGPATGGMSHPGAEPDNAEKMKTVPSAGGMSHPEAEPDHEGKMKTVSSAEGMSHLETESDYVGQLKRMGFATAAMALREDSCSVDDPRLMKEERLAVILGTEGEGLRDSTINACDYTVMIPMTHGVDSLNVAAASAIAFWQLGRRI